METVDRVKPFKTYEDQIELLKSRGMIIRNEQKARDVLRSENYYRLSGYWLTMLRNKDRNTTEFYPGTTFDDVLELYRFDQKLRNLILGATLTIETNLKSFVAYYHGRKYGPCGYICNEYVEDAWNHASFMKALMNDFNQRKEEAFVRHHRDDLNGVYPIWVVTEVCSFDQISKFYRNMLPADRTQMAKEFYGISSRDYVESWLHVSVVARNMAAHGARFYNKTYLKPAVKLPKHLNRYAASPFGYVYAIYSLLPVTDRQDFLDQIGWLMEDYTYTKLQYMGFPPDWKTLIIRGAEKGQIPPYTEEIHEDILRYRGYGWEWPIVTKLVNRIHGHEFTPAELQKLHMQYPSETEM